MILNSDLWLCCYFLNLQLISVSTFCHFKALTTRWTQLPLLCPHSKWGKIFHDSHRAIIWSSSLCPFPWSLIASYQQDPPSSLITSLLLFRTDLFLPFSAVINRDFWYFFPDIQKLLDMQWDNHDASTVVQRDNGPSGITSSSCLQLNFFSLSINLLCMCVLCMHF